MAYSHLYCSGDFSRGWYRMSPYNRSKIERSQYQYTWFLIVSDYTRISSLFSRASGRYFSLQFTASKSGCHSHLWCSTRYTDMYVCSLMSWYIYLTVAFRDKIRSKTVKRDYKTLHSNVEFFILLLLYIRDWLFLLHFSWSLLPLPVLVWIVSRYLQQYLLLEIEYWDFHEILRWEW